MRLGVERFCPRCAARNPERTFVLCALNRMNYVRISGISTIFDTGVKGVFNLHGGHRMARKMERVVVTGMGVVSPLGCSVTEFWDGLLAGQSGVKSLEGSDFSGMETGIGATVLEL